MDCRRSLSRRSAWILYATTGEENDGVADPTQIGGLATERNAFSFRMIIGDRAIVNRFLSARVENLFDRDHPAIVAPQVVAMFQVSSSDPSLAPDVERMLLFFDSRSRSFPLAAKAG
jgi:hypothetical protein